MAGGLQKLLEGDPCAILASDTPGCDEVMCVRPDLVTLPMLIFLQ